MTSEHAGTKKECLKLTQLANYDDLLTDALIDRVYFWTTIRKNRCRYSACRGHREEEISSIIRQHVIFDKDPAEACVQLLKLPGLKRFSDKLSFKDKEHFQRHLRKYVNIYLPDCPFEVSTTNRYTIDTQEAAATARRWIKKGELIKYLSGIQVAISREEEKDLDLTRRDFSIVMSSRKRTPSLFLGPARFANHDCEANARLTTKGPNGMTVVAVEDINVGEEITVSYGEDYFGISNCECLCATCEELQRNGWAPTLIRSVEDVILEPRADTPTRDHRLASKYTQSPTPEIRSHLQTKTPERIQSTSQKRKRKRQIAIQPVLGMSIDQTKVLRLDTNKQSETKVPLAVRPQVTTYDRKSASLKDCGSSAERSLSPWSALDGSHQGSCLSDTSTTASSISEVDQVPDKRVVYSNNKSSHEKLGEVIQNLVRADQQELDDILIETKSTIFAEDSISELSDLPDDEEMDDACGVVVKRKVAIQPRMTRRAFAQLPRKQKELLFAVEPAFSLTARISLSSDVENPRKPGDYTLTARLLSNSYSRWVKCRVCDSDFVQSEAYLTRWSCPRCERHSKLYGYQWPKTDKAGKHDTEERVLDHRTVHRFVWTDEERAFKKGNKTLTSCADSDLEQNENESEAEGYALNGKPSGRFANNSRLSSAAASSHARKKPKLMQNVHDPSKTHQYSQSLPTARQTKASRVRSSALQQSSILRSNLSWTSSFRRKHNLKPFHIGDKSNTLTAVVGPINTEAAVSTSKIQIVKNGQSSTEGMRHGLGAAEIWAMTRLNSSGSHPQDTHATRKFSSRFNASTSPRSPQIPLPHTDGQQIYATQRSNKLHSINPALFLSTVSSKNIAFLDLHTQPRLSTAPTMEKEHGTTVGDDDECERKSHIGQAATDFPKIMQPSIVGLRSIVPTSSSKRKYVKSGIFSKRIRRPLAPARTTDHDATMERRVRSRCHTHALVSKLSTSRKNLDHSMQAKRCELEQESDYEDFDQGNTIGISKRPVRRASHGVKLAVAAAADSDLEDVSTMKRSKKKGERRTRKMK